MYQKVRLPPAAGAVKVCAIELSPLVGVVAPTWAAYDPLCPPLTTELAAPLGVQPESVPVSNPPLTMPPPLAGGVTVSETLVVCVAEVPVPVTVTGYVPAVVLATTEKVSVELLPEVTLTGLNEAVVPAGRPLVEKVTLCALPLVVTVEMALVPLLPCVMETLVGLAPMEKSFATGADTASVTVVVWVADAPVPVMVMGYEPTGVLAEVARVSVELPPEVTLPGLNDAVAPEGNPLAERLTFWAAPVVTAVEMVLVPLLPRTTDTVVGLALMEKSLVATAPQPESLKVATCVSQLKVPFEGMYSVVNQKVQLSTGSTLRFE